eukprot:TRINITY_DN48340_c0_g1_i1.p1 TRINITY_DN48340_c0_g1~~TRINITY_DN48340_c0_g1_i1.p1  ORF type:complete len:214 (-),score=8.94 TRINITY_DN48340_c0_g1_i1:150-791(-)
MCCSRGVPNLWKAAVQITSIASACICISEAAPRLSCDWTVVPPISVGGDRAPGKFVLRVASSHDGTPMSWMVGDVWVRRVVHFRQKLPCSAQTLLFEATHSGVTSTRPAAIVVVGNTSTALGGDTGGAMVQWDVLSVRPGHHEFVLSCPDGSRAFASVSEKVERRGWSRRINLRRFCPGVWHHLMVNIRATAPILSEVYRTTWDMWDAGLRYA